MRACWLSLVTVLAVLTTHPSVTAAPPPFPITVNRSGTGESDRYCGLYCVYQAGRITGRAVDLDQLIRPDRLQGEFGSTAANLVDCCREFGINYSYLPNGSYADVCLLGGPAIVLVKSGPEAQRADHWVLVLKAGPGSAEIYDPSVGVIRVSAAEMKSLWGGPVIVIFDAAGAPEAGVAWAATKILLLAALAGVTLVVLRSAGRTRLHPALVLASTSVALAGAGHLADPAGFAHNTDVLTQMGKVQHPRVPERMAPSELLAGGGPLLVVDARTPSQFNAARIPGAVNIPIGAARRRNQRKLAAVPAGTRVVIYCNSASCPWAQGMASSSLFQHFDSVFVLDGGLEAYEAAGGKLTSGSPQRDEVR